MYEEKSAYWKQIYNSLQEKDTQELLAIWKKNDREEWSDAAFDVLKAILQQRVGILPEQNAETGEDSADLDPLHDADMLMRIGYWARISSWIIPLILTVHFLYVTLRAFFVGPFNPINQFGFSSWLTLNNIFDSVYTVATAAFYFIVLQGVAHGIDILLDIYANTAPEAQG